MPIWVDDERRLRMRCINAPQGDGIAGKAFAPDGTFVDHIMKMAGGWGVIGGMLPPPPDGSGPVPASTHGMPVRVYYCQTCGYVELYNGLIVSPEVWRQNG
jgi:hypothetical protein